MPVDQTPPALLAEPCLRVIDLETAGNGRDDVCEIGWQDVIRRDDGRWVVSQRRGSMLINPGHPISADTMAIHHIRDEDAAGAPFWKEAAPSVLRPEHPILALVAHRAAFEQRYCTPRLTGATPWICTWKCALRVWPELPRFSNQMLRYLRRPEGLDHALGLPAHRALPDAYVTAHHLRDLLEAAPLGDLLRWSREPGLLPRVPNGPERGKSWDRLSLERLAELARDRDGDIRFSAETEIARRQGTDPVQAGEADQRRLL
ncbi:DNA polymerase III subunit epsilon [Rhizobium rhizosphaerae]|uniref:DNA polymerase III subunit epsilon n=1 Tax=Xaviernesmea rhizosphaerae TaxID=1672749 RepID=A0ABX3PDI0_9HYPH|nr:exonuclease domain-containing protein [Xaviernesmea rhizosphaerae]OQP86472.1 DNA polymerase III subunit epsilon [Xaviernesmea rhizosphaerae]